MNNGNSYFDGKLHQIIGWTLLCLLVVLIIAGITTQLLGTTPTGIFITFLSLLLVFPWAHILIYRWEIEHTVIEGKRLKFTGNPMDLFMHWLIWAGLCIITLGIYGFWLNIKLKQWKVKNTTFENY